MAKYLFHINYTTQGARGLIQEGGSARKAATEKAAESLGGRVEAMYFALGETDAYIIADMPDLASVAAISLTVAAGGGTTARTTVLMSAEEMDQATQRTPNYKPPGQ